MFYPNIYGNKIKLIKNGEFSVNVIYDSFIKDDDSKELIPCKVEIQNIILIDFTNTMSYNIENFNISFYDGDKKSYEVSVDKRVFIDILNRSIDCCIKEKEALYTITIFDRKEIGERYINYGSYISIL